MAHADDAFFLLFSPLFSYMTALIRHSVNVLKFCHPQPPLIFLMILHVLPSSSILNCVKAQRHFRHVQPLCHCPDFCLPSDSFQTNHHAGASPVESDFPVLI